ncbi:NAD(P)Hquinone oxidoreductase, type IV [Rubrobacter radiotolerans]|uniref:NAD(P)H:quinone oxidoreductase n=1 Tax=Rubrobacter radiotolerans TaxID=42256 RepID=A0A023X5E6_RUBRA|nr:NAD(P)H:quinone oxidoreductase [Rubrobacter radiotolerans]AHY47294.1 NAD(P)Hquinone oxidoreductase, type IV [Rubrobacter radiotolerans]MDX5894699.1 NAD(P)H:quinone oxidoreductase [Rubrobacter radiotolerans]SMC06569.1 NAD(P)H dehydrogenase (quinone) [Rubrobacter radiotolerans DSM 5868]
MTKVAVIYYSATGNVYKLAQAIKEGAEEAGAEVRLRKVHELAPEEAIKSNQGWADHAEKTQDVPEASMDDLEWADAYIFGTPTRFGNVSAQLKQFIDTTGGLWAQGKLADKVVSGFTSAQNAHGGQESTLLSMYNVFMHWGSIIVPTGYTSDEIFAAGGNPYGISSTDGGEQGPSEEELAAARYQGRRVAEKAAALTASKV